MTSRFVTPISGVGLCRILEETILRLEHEKDALPETADERHVSCVDSIERLQFFPRSGRRERRLRANHRGLGVSEFRSGSAVGSGAVIPECLAAEPPGAVEVHAITRARERYGLKLTLRDLGLAQEAIAGGGSLVMRRVVGHGRADLEKQEWVGRARRMPFQAPQRRAWHSRGRKEVPPQGRRATARASRTPGGAFGERTSNPTCCPYAAFGRNHASNLVRA